MSVERAMEMYDDVVAHTDDSEAAHCKEDQLREEVLEMIRDNSTCPEAVALATIALRTSNLDFNRWTA